MVDVHRPDHFPDPPAEHSANRSDDHNERSLNSLVRAISLASGRRFSLILAHCNYHHLQEDVMQRLRDACSVQWVELSLPPSAQTLYSGIKQELGDRPIPALVVSGLDQVQHLDKLLLSANQVRDEFKQFNFPLVLWVNDQVLSDIVRLAPDFYNWAASPISFHWTPVELAQRLCRRSQQVVTHYLRQAQQGHLFTHLSTHVSTHLPSQQTANGGNGAGFSAISRILSTEMTTALQRLEQNGQRLAPDVSANVHFVLGCNALAAYQFDPAIAHYRESLALWQQTGQFEYVSLVLCQLGRCAIRQAEGDRANQIHHWTTAETYFHQCLEACDAANRPDLKATFITYRGDALKSLQRWDDLQQLIDDAHPLHQQYPNPVEQARFLMFQAEVWLTHPDQGPDQNGNGYALAQRALQQLSDTPEGQPYLAEARLLVARTQQRLGDQEGAIATLRQARTESTPDHNPLLYIQILEALQVLYFQQKQYDKAFIFKREKLSVESQYGFRAFVGAGRLRSTRAISDTVEQREMVAQEIAVSGRQRDLEKLIERIERNDCKLTLVHGQLGVGKSSLLQAGLKPMLDQATIQARDVITVVTRVYSNWAEKLGEYLTLNLQDKQRHLRRSPNSPSDLLEQLRDNEQQNLITVLVFDQFEEFFFICQGRSQREMFFNFLSECLNIPFVKVILSLREDYLHYLLEWERTDAFASMSADLISDILSKEHRYELGNFSVSDAQTIIQTLTDNSQFYLQPHLIDRLVQDLVDDRGEIRPIELQVVGAQLYEESVRTLEQYDQLGDRPKETLVQHYLDGVIRDCGPENEDAARLVLYTLTGENNTRPPKTREEIETDLKALEKGLVKEAEKLDLVLEIFRKSGLVFLIPELPADRYQLVHDYLVSFIRQQRPKIDELIRELEAKREELNQAKLKIKTVELERVLAAEEQRRSKAELKLAINRRNLTLIGAIFTVALAILGAIQWVRQADYSTEFAFQIGNNLVIRNNHSQDLMRNQEIDAALVEILKASEILDQRYSQKQQRFRINSQETARDVIRSLQQLVALKIAAKNDLSDVSDVSRDSLHQNLDTLSPNELNTLRIQLNDLGCMYVDRDVLEERKWKGTLCQ